MSRFRRMLLWATLAAVILLTVLSIYGAFIGAMSSLIGVFSAWPAGTMFAILLANMFAPLLDVLIRGMRGRAAAGAGAKT